MKPSLPKGTRDFLPDQCKKRNYIFQIIQQAFESFGYQPIETPAMEKLSTLTGKYGEEGDQLLFKVLNNGDFLAKVDEAKLRARDSAGMVSELSKRGLRYDLTVPFARFVVMHQNDLSFPFKRYQIQPVWRADRPGKGRYQEFYQCDADVVGSDSLMYEVEFIQLFDQVFQALQLPVTIRMNNRKILSGIAELTGLSDHFEDLAIAIDKLDKIGLDGVMDELVKRQIPQDALPALRKFLVQGLLPLEESSLEKLQAQLSDSSIGSKGVGELRTVWRYLQAVGELSNDLTVDLTLARGLNYYTGCIFEVIAQDARMGSIAAGGRYADLTGVFGMKNTSGVGISFGAERIYDLLEALDGFPNQAAEGAIEVLLVAFDEDTHLFAFQQLQHLRKAGISAELYPEPVKIKKQLKYANDRQVPYVLLIGSEEMQTGFLTLKNMTSGEQESIPIETLLERLVD